jgi:hypothetical protein
MFIARAKEGFPLSMPFVCIPLYGYSGHIVLLVCILTSARGFQDEAVIDEITIALFHESIHQAICRLVGETESKDYDKVPHFNMEIEKWLEWR